MKRLLFAVITVTAMAVSPGIALAHGGHHGRVKTVSYSVCPVNNCYQAGLHAHGSRTYSAHYYGDGHTHHSHGAFHH